MILPESKQGGYTIEKQPLSVDVEMISGRLVRELRGHVWYITYQYGYFDTDIKNKLIGICEKGRNAPIRCGFLPPDSTGSLIYSVFFVMAFTYPKFMWSRRIGQGEEESIVPLWGDFALELREVKPSD